MKNASHSFIKQSLIIMVVSFTSFVFIFFASLFAQQESEWIWKLFQLKIFLIPIIFYMLLLAVSFGVTTSIYLSILQKKQFAPIEEKIHLLAQTNYSHSKLEELQVSQIYPLALEEDLRQIRDKMREMSRELQELNAQPRLFDGETKEEILENERRRLARELHDSVSQQLFAAMMLLSALQEKVKKSDASNAQMKQLAMVAEIISLSQSEMRALLLHLRPISLEGKTLSQGIEMLLKELQTKVHLKLKWSVSTVQLEPNIEDQLFRITQELLSNTLRHAKAKELEVYLLEVDHNIVLRVIDDGIGFDTAQKKVGSYGLMNIRERATSLGGALKVISFKNQGTSIEIKIPLIKGEMADDTGIIGR